MPDTDQKLHEPELPTGTGNEIEGHDPLSDGALRDTLPPEQLVLQDTSAVRAPTGGGVEPSGKPGDVDEEDPGSGDVDTESTELDSKVDQADTPQGDPGGEQPGGGAAPDSLLGSSPSIGLFEDWGASSEDASFVTVLPFAPQPTTGPVQTLVGPADPSTALATQDANAGFYTLEQRQEIAGQAFSRGLEGGVKTALVGFGIDAAGLAASVGGQRLIAMGTTGGKIAGGALGTAVPVFGGVMAGVNLYNTFAAADQKFAAPWNTMLDGNASGYQRLAGGLELTANVLGVVSDVLGIAAAILAIAGVISAIAGVGFALGGLALQLSGASTAVTIAAAAVSAIAAFVRYLCILESDGNPAEVQADAEALAAHVENTGGQLGGLISNAASSRVESHLQIKEVGADVEAGAPRSVIDDALGVAPSGPLDADGGKFAATDVSRIGTQDLDLPVTATDPGDVEIEFTPPKPIEVDVSGQAPKLDPTKATGGGMLQPTDFEQMTLSEGDYKLYQTAFETAPDLRTQSDIETLQLVDLYQQDVKPVDPTLTDVDVLHATFSETELVRLKELQDADPTSWTPHDKYLMGKRAMTLDAQVVPGQSPVSKVISDTDDGSAIKGFVAFGETGDHKTGADLVQERGLGYTDGAGKTPYLHPDGTPIDDVKVVESTLTQEMYDARKLPILPGLEETMKNLGLPYRVQNEPKPFTGTGAAGTGEHTTLSNEYTIWNGHSSDGTFKTLDPEVSKHGPSGRDKAVTSVTKEHGGDDGVRRLAAGPGLGAKDPSGAPPPRRQVPAGSDGAGGDKGGFGPSDVHRDGAKRRRLPTANAIAQTSGVLQGMMLPDTEYEPPEATTPQPLPGGVGAMEWLMGALPAASSLQQSTTSVSAPVYDAASALGALPPSGETVGLEPIPALPHDPAEAAYHLGLAGVAAGRVQMLEEQLRMVQAMIGRADGVLGDAGPYKVVEDVQETRRARFEENEEHAEAVRTTLDDAEERKRLADEEKATAEDGIEEPDSGPVAGLMGLIGNSAVRGLVKVGGGVAKVGASIVNGVGSLLGADEPVIDTKTIDDLMRLFDVGEDARSKNKDAQSKKDGPADAIGDMGAKIETNTAELDDAESFRAGLVTETDKLDAQLDKERSVQTSHVTDLEGELARLTEERDLALSASEHASSVANAELTGLAEHRARTAAVVQANQDRIAQARAASEAGALTSDEQAQVDLRRSRIALLRDQARAAVSDAGALVSTSRMQAFAVNGFELPPEHSQLAEGEVDLLRGVVDAQILPLLLVMEGDLGAVTRDRVAATLAAVDAGLASCAETLAVAQERAQANIVGYFCFVKRSA